MDSTSVLIGLKSLLSHPSILFVLTSKWRMALAGRFQSWCTHTDQSFSLYALLQHLAHVAYMSVRMWSTLWYEKLAEECASHALTLSTLKLPANQQKEQKTMQPSKLVMVKAFCDYSVMMVPSSLMFSWLLDMWAGFPLWLDNIMPLRVTPTLLGNEMLCGRGLTTLELYSWMLDESLMRLVLLLVTRWESNGVRQSFSRMRSPSSSSSLSPSAMLLLEYNRAGNSDIQCDCHENQVSQIKSWQED